jgi:hypothetical protein
MQGDLGDFWKDKTLITTCVCKEFDFYFGILFLVFFFYFLRQGVAM